MPAQMLQLKGQLNHKKLTPLANPRLPFARDRAESIISTVSD